MRSAGLAGIYRRRRNGCTVRDPAATPHPDLVNRQFTADRPDRLWVTDITQHRTGQGWLYCAVVLDVYSRRVVGWSIADHLRTELVLDALDMARWRRKPAPGGTVLYADHGCQYTSWAFGQRLRAAGLLGSMGSAGDCYDNSLAESFFGTLQLELLDTRTWATPAGTRQRDLRTDRGLVQPRPPTLSPGLPQPRQLRKDAPKAAHSGSMTTTANPSGKPGEAHSCTRAI